MQLQDGELEKGQGPCMQLIVLQFMAPLAP